MREIYAGTDNKEKGIPLNPKLGGVPLAFCFKDFYTEQNKGQKNQVHTRSLHAEENAFLQLAKYGSPGIEGGYLFTTASCCELCAKKAYQLGITKIYYIDTYPGISFSHIFRSGDRKDDIQIILFQGIIGRAYDTLYSPFFPLKDEIEYLTGVEIKYEGELITSSSRKKAKSDKQDDIPTRKMSYLKRIMSYLKGKFSQVIIKMGILQK